MEGNNMSRLNQFMNENRKICWDAEFEDGEFCIGENKVKNYIEHLEETIKRLTDLAKKE